MGFKLINIIENGDKKTTLKDILSVGEDGVTQIYIRQDNKTNLIKEAGVGFVEDVDVATDGYDEHELKEFGYINISIADYDRYLQQALKHIARKNSTSDLIVLNRDELDEKVKNYAEDTVITR